MNNSNRNRVVNREFAAAAAAQRRAARFQVVAREGGWDVVAPGGAVVFAVGPGRWFQAAQECRARNAAGRVA